MALTSNVQRLADAFPGLAPEAGEDVAVDAQCDANLAVTQPFEVAVNMPGQEYGRRRHAAVAGRPCFGSRDCRPETSSRGPPTMPSPATASRAIGCIWARKWVGLCLARLRSGGEIERAKYVLSLGWLHLDPAECAIQPALRKIEERAR